MYKILYGFSLTSVVSQPTKVYPVGAVIIFAMLAIASQTYWYFFGYDTIYYLLIIASDSVSIFSCMSYIFSTNISMVSFTIQTFDFWYKMYNLMLWIVTSYFVIPDFNQNSYVYVIGSFSAVCGYGLSFVLDATSIENKYKNTFIILVVSWGAYNALNVYFLIDDANYYWNPFEQYNFEYSNIHFKSVYVSSQTNLCLFMLKPIFSQINHKMRRYMCLRKNRNTLGQTSYVLYKRAHVHWVGVGSSSEMEMSNHITAM